VLVAACGSIGVLALPQYLLAIRRHCEPVELRVLLSDDAAQMLPAHSVALFCDEALAPGRWSANEGGGHIEMAAWADLVVVLPATCDVIGRVANGLTDKAVPLVISAHHSPVMFFPNMNLRMWNQAATRRNVSTLAADGHLVVDPIEQESYEATTRSWGVGCVMPPPRATADLLKAELDRRSE
jgi:phosphopantothenoylcysteine synthetase/decarboxylase